MNTLEHTYETVIGLEVHVQLSTQSKAFCRDDAAFGAAPNTRVSPVSLGHPGTLPMPNRQHFAFAVRLGLALGSQIQLINTFDRKNYFYADLPKGYQITQDGRPICVGGALSVRLQGETKPIRIHHIHIEEDAGKSMHDQVPDASLIDLNRAGVPLLEIVTEPDLRSAEEVDAFMSAMRRLVRYLEISDGNMEQGSMRCDVNVSVRPEGSAKLGNRCEIKNLNSMRFARRAIAFETRRQIALVESGAPVVQQTLHFDPDTGATSPLRSKEEAHDYRYFPEPDIPPVVLRPEYVESIRAQLPPLPEKLYADFRNDYQLSDYDAAILVEEKSVAMYFLAFCAATPHFKAAANLIINRIMPWCEEQKCPITHFPVTMAVLADMLELVESNRLSHSTALQKLLPALMENPQQGALQMAESMNLMQVGDADFIGSLIEEILQAFPDKVAEYKKGKKGLQGFFLGELMRRSGGKADPKAATVILVQKLEKP
jgi:aspartyl-tRNA(Asn)/glutamyl-tRNA(Gln) amidotransferase subunit B